MTAGEIVNSTRQNPRHEDQRLLGGDALFLGGMVLFFSLLCPGFGIAGLTLAGVLIASGGFLFLLSRHGTRVPHAVSSGTDKQDWPARNTPRP